MTITLFEVLKQLFKKPNTNPFPVKYAPAKPGGMHAAVAPGGPVAELLAGEVIAGVTFPPVPVPHRFRGLIEYDRTACIGCKMCIKVCPAEVIEYIEPTEEEKEANAKAKGKVKFNMSRCTFCAFCTDTCPKSCIRMGKAFLVATTDRFSEDLIVTDSGNFTAEEYDKDQYY
jgi:formate hydrogenlyase subunit 6/NADH:ubiquinone oxidoreductase subunit I